MENSIPKKQMTEDERQELAKKLDEDLEKFINSFEKRKYTEGWAPDRWEEELKKHPFFMKEAPEAGDELSPLMEGLQQLKYDPNENTPEELANAYKDDGNFNFKLKKYRWAIIAYTEGIKIKCGNKEIQATLYNNRSAAHYFIQNYRSSLKDAEVAAQLKPDYEKALIRAAHCCYHMELYEKAIKMCDDLLTKKSSNADLLKLRSNSVNANKAKERDYRKRQANLSKQMQAEQVLLDTILGTGIEIYGTDGDRLNVEHLKPKIPELADSMVHLDEDGKLIWPVILIYPEYFTVDYIKEVHEDDTLQVHLNEVLRELPEWDKDKKYSTRNINVYVETKDQKLHKVDVNQNLGQILRLPGYVVNGGTPAFNIVINDSPYEKYFLKQF